ncbi:acyltransferase family protein [Agrococcus jejuensis]|uniref:Peptidoglycan/LPS O-acetylase OafA/YrhL, contains acyltransferase and SGNH-hydrolase domains n=1 Tax=Agrococcus jejuensis TaxID=399736 RepID=A0A1G8BKI7_9MICO|nr:acyltransferase family protein [Agrococcus jejuensis]SDH33638.1 Peptidoglycan/LPS O-acetylase OafA/YrhL, contains acyltransferase and SGNH-hydrolase domains [Agrococcus jejuensis]
MLRPPSDALLADRRLGGLDGLRAIAVALVVAYHVAPDVVPGGLLGVDVFLVLSGFLITTLLLRDRRAGTWSLGTFWMRRARRLLPALVVVVLASCALAAIVGGDVLVGLGRQLVGAATFSSNWVAIAAGDSYVASTTPQLLRTLWSLAVEEQFYLVWPLALLAHVRLPRAVAVGVLVALAAASAVAMAVVGGTDVDRAYLGTDTHAFGLLLGAALALVAASWPAEREAWHPLALRVLPIVGLAGVAAALVLAVALADGSGAATGGGLAAASVATVAAIVGGVAPGSWLGRALDARPLAWIGERSYAIYLWHWPLLLLTLAAWPMAPRPVVAAAVVAATLALAAVSYRVVEQPIRRHGLVAVVDAWRTRARRGARGLAVTATAALVAVASVAGTTVAVAQAPAESSASATIGSGLASLETSEPAVPDGPSPAPAAASEEAEASEPAPEPQSATPTGDEIVAVGDSVMLASADELQAALPGIQIDAAVSRRLHDGVDALLALEAQGALREWIVVGLGTNGAVDPADVQALLDLAGRGHRIVLVDAYAERGWTADVNAALRAAADASHRVDVAEWNAAISPRLDLLAGDRIHPGHEGSQLYVGAVQASIDRLAALVKLSVPA